MRTWLVMILGTVLGAGMLVFSVADLAGDHGVSCGSQQMKKGDTCVSIGHGRSEHRSIAQQEAKNTRQDWIGVGVGLFLTLGCGGIVCAALAQRSGRRDTPQHL